MVHIKENISATIKKIRELEIKYGRPEKSLRLLAVSKHHSINSIREAASSGVVNFGENFLQEAEKKIIALSSLQLNWHFIGPIQSNKTKGIAEHFNWVQSLDREKIAIRLNEQRPSNKSQLNICIQVNLSEEESKSGTHIENAQSLCALVKELPQLRLRGIMAIPAPEQNFTKQRECFQQLFVEYSRLQNLFPTMDTLSMGMSNDLEAAIAEGSTMLRLGTALFGPRS